MALSDLRRVAAVAALLAVAAIGLRARGAFSHAANAAATAISGGALAVTLAVTEGVALVAFIVVLVSARRQHERQEEDTEYLIVLRRWLRYPLFVLALAALAVPPFLLYVYRRTGPATRPPPAPGGAGLQPGTSQHLPPPSAGLVPILAGAGIAAGALLAFAIYARVRSRHGHGTDAERHGLAARLAAATDALHQGADPRQAIIACYAELERGFADAGSAPRNADTPAEVLGRAASAGLIRSRSAADLTGLFRRARYGAQPMTPADSAMAGHALDAMRAELASQQRP
jgi:Domain of unknown function (DUF4129)